ncbi:unnamed protein product [Orchesella dallaii]|uniref:Major facilitator superfamily (MFS) profile domain-containing protein n=1 Tax=Orchesella dallaii TaxID=48710 RepID=A0ABP1Q7P9_9HEXA
MDESNGTNRKRAGDEDVFYGYLNSSSAELDGNVKLEEMEPLTKAQDDGNLNGNNNISLTSKIPNGSKKCEDFEEILEVVGSQGRFQKILLYAVLCPIVTVSPFLVLNTVFMWDVPDHSCHVPGRDPDMSIEEWKNLTLPWELGPDQQWRHSQCKMFENVTSGKEIKCQFGWDFDKTDYESTIPSEYEWVCDNDFYATDCFTWGSFGSAIGTILFGIMADKYGRKPTFFMACFVNVLFKTVSLFLAHRYMVYKTLQFLGGFAFPALFSMPALISAEVSGTTYRSWIYAVTWMIWVVGNSLIPFVAMVCRTWFIFGCVAAVPGFFLFLYIWMVDESPRWLISVDKTERAIQIILKIARTNGKQVDPDVIDRMVQELAAKQKKEAEGQNFGVWTLFSKFQLAKNTVMLITAWTMNALLYYGVTLNSTHMAGNTFVNYFLLSIIELPGGWLAGKLVETTGRRWTQAAFFLLCTLSCLLCAVAVAYPNSSVIVIIGALGIKFGVTVASLVVYLQGTEIFPTMLRSTGSGLASTVSSCVGIFGPYIVYSGTVHVSFPYAILCVCSFIGLLAATCLPETFRQPLPESIQDANKFGKGQKFWSYLPQQQESGSDVKKKGSMCEKF